MNVSLAAPRASLSFFQVLDDHLDPVVRRLDYVLVAAADRYLGEGYYLLSNPFGEIASYHCTGFGESRDKPLLLGFMNKFYGKPTSISKDEFGRRVVAKVVMTCRVQDHTLIDRNVFTPTNHHAPGAAHAAR